MKIKLDELENKLGYKIKNNCNVVGFDTAKRSGICFIRTKREYAHFDWFFLEFEANNHKEVLKQMYKEFNDILSDEDLAIVEEVFLGRNRAGSLHLAKMGALVIANCIKKEIDFETILAVTARSKLKINTRSFGKGNSKKAVAHWLKETLNIEVDDEDISDSIVLALIGICEGMDYKAKTKKKKRKRRKS